jgi:hypothetical protein
MFPGKRDAVRALGFRRENKDELNIFTTAVIYGVRMLHCPKRQGSNAEFGEAAARSPNYGFILRG